MKGPPDTLPSDKQEEHVAEENIERVEDDLPEEVIDPELSRSDGDEQDAEDLLTDYGWMANEEEFNQQVLAEIEQEEYLDEFFEQIRVIDERHTWVMFYQPPSNPSDDPEVSGNLESNFDKLAVDESPASTSQSQDDLSPDAIEYIPRSESQS